MKTKILILTFLSGFLNYLSASVDFTASNVCKGSYTTLEASSSYADAEILYYKWDLNNDGIFADATGKKISYLFADADTFPVRVRVTTTDGSNHDMTAPKDVIVFPIPDVNFHIDNICEGKTAMFQSTSTLNYGTIKQYIWDFNNDGNPDHLDTLSGSFSMYFGEAASFITKLEVVTDKSCRSFATKSTQVYHTPEALFSVQNACAGENTMFINQSTLAGGEPVLYNLWDFGDGQQAASPGNQAHQYNSPGSFSAKLIVVSANNCKDTFILNTAVNPLPTLTLEFSGDTVFYEGDKVTITAKGDFSSVKWSTGETTPSVTINQSVSDTVTAFSASGCKIKKTVRTSSIQADTPVIFNNILTPNGDGINDLFIIENLSRYVKCDLFIYNSYGDKVFWQNGYNNGWGGQLNGKSHTLDAGAYYYIIDTDKGSFTGCLNIIH